MSARVAESADRVAYSGVRAIAEMAMAMDGVLRLYFGESSTPTPDFIKRAAADAMEAGFTFYTENAGLPSLRREIAASYGRLHGIELDPATEIVVTASGVQALNVAVRCVLDPGDEAVVLTPAWPNGARIVELCGGTAREVPQPVAGQRYGLDLDAIEAAIGSRTRLLLCTSPSNPLGWVATEEEQRALLELCRRYGLWLVADEVYERLYWRDTDPAQPAPSILRLATREDAVVVIQSFSKAYCMTGWRVGWLVARRDLARKAGELNEYIISHAPAFAQKAGELALRDGEDELRTILACLDANRELCLAALRRMPGLTVPEPEGAFYLFPRVEGLDDSFGFCSRLLVEQKVGLAPGVAFGAGGEGSIRLCYAAEQPILEEALRRLEDFLATSSSS
jgi:aspartate/methionine/tyrosine aminotransferase